MTRFELLHALGRTPLRFPMTKLHTGRDRGMQRIQPKTTQERVSSVSN